MVRTINLYVADKTNAIGLDYASNGLYVDNNGNVGTNHKYYRESHDKLAKAQRRLSRMQGSKKHEDKSNNYIKQLRKVNKIHRRRYSLYERPRYNARDHVRQFQQ